MGKIFIHDSEKDILETLTIALELEGFIVYPLLDCGNNFLDHIEEFRPHVVVLDYRLTGELCIQALNQIKAKYPHLPVVATSCNTNIQEVYSEYGFEDYIKKPFDIDLLYAVLRKHIKSDGV
ncbi:response regulator [Pedobacter sp. SYSU D00535]|uniref:response regulator n=1 Tax=Pedobacter sp. SYSU D00535 TaxID=2810308 RepID=UPI001A978C73|nr:response regulator [Pedobacter sp. SYSU D00535]